MLKSHVLNLHSERPETKREKKGEGERGENKERKRRKKENVLANVKESRTQSPLP